MKNVTVIQCKDCKYNSLPETSGNALCEKLYGMTDPDGYCSLAERKDSYSGKTEGEKYGWYPWEVIKENQK